MLRQSKQIKQGLVMGMRLAVLEKQAAAVVAEGRMITVFLPGAYQLEQDKMPPLRPDEKCSWLYPAQLYFLNMSPAQPAPWQPQEPLLTRDTERGLMQLTLVAEYTVQVENAALFMQNMVLKRGFHEWTDVHNYVCGRLNEVILVLLAHNQTSVARLGKIKEKIARTLLQCLNLSLRSSGLTLLDMCILELDVHPQMRHLLQEQKEYLAFNRAVLRSIVG